ncbi:phospholipase D-like domain-containing protein [Dyella japonica]|uniref:Phospholipase n=1 Tax=Dyella japonica A8 TaxID=1217721 RepID=A0A075JZP0_9GAMM|nr:phosphatidylserine/phosphatidylglycerophosphate/cardiolipin synthase family protein [Dyella japonica]AIF46972.1 phospholipase [Dyella japonica A8]
MSKPATTVPIALSRDTTADLTLPWFVQKAEYLAAPATFKPLVNGEEAFGAVYDAIFHAKKTVDIICWGFQPSMYFKRGAEGRGTLPIGTLLEEKGKQGVMVRLLCWYDPLHLTDVFSENMQPGNNPASLMADTRNSAQRELDARWYFRARYNDVTKTSLPERMIVTTRDIATAVGAGVLRAKPFDNLEFANRSFDFLERTEIAWRTWLQGADIERSADTKAMNSGGMGVVPTHHQKTVLVDVEDPGRAIGFVMGHNMLDEYWDTNEHSSVRLHPQMGRNGKHARQDISSRVTGPILKSLNHNFCTAWDRATGQDLTATRAAIRYPETLRVDEGTPVIAQILRTQSQEGKCDIEKMYLQAVNNATQFIYIENQYFRWKPLVDQLQQAVRKQIEWGRVTGEHGAVHLFVVTNASDEGIGDGTVNTYRMLDALGRADTIPNVAKAERNTALLKQRHELEKRVSEERAIQNDPGVGTGDPYGYSLSTSQRQTLRSQSRGREQSAQQQVDQLDQQIKKNNDEKVLSTSIDGLKVHICTLVSPDTPPAQPWQYTYVHAKLMIVDDVFTTLGSANINTRSMEGDSELNICHEHSGVTQPLRRKLWGLHTKGVKDGASDDPADAFDAWAVIIDQNKKRQKANETPGEAHQTPYAPLVEFQYTGTKRSILD